MTKTTPFDGKHYFKGLLLGVTI